jgi:hypothetical protein
MKPSRYLTYAWTFVCACDDPRNTYIYVLVRDRHNVKLYYAPSWKICGRLITETATVRTHVTQQTATVRTHDTQQTATVRTHVTQQISS